MKRLLTFTAFLFTTAYTFAQGEFINTSFEEAKEIKKRTLLVVLPEEDSHFLSQLADENPDLKVPYENDIAGQREAMKKAVEEHWTYNEHIYANSYKEAKELMKAHPDKYAMLRIGEQTQDRLYVNNNHQRIKQKTGWQKTNDQFIYSTEKRYFLSMMGITTLVIEIPKRVMRTYLPKLSPTEGDFIFSINEMQYLLSTIMKLPELSTGKVYRNASFIPSEQLSKTLLIDGREAGFEEGDDLGKIYPYPFLLVDYRVIEKALIERDAKYIILQESRYDTENSVYNICSAVDGTIYGHTTASTFKYGTIDGAKQSIQVQHTGVTLSIMKQLSKK